MIIRIMYAIYTKGDAEASAHQPVTDTAGINHHEVLGKSVINVRDEYCYSH
jgi:hypothetical protein